MPASVFSVSDEEEADAAFTDSGSESERRHLKKAATKTVTKKPAKAKPKPAPRALPTAAAAAPAAAAASAPPVAKAAAAPDRGDSDGENGAAAPRQPLSAVKQATAAQPRGGASARAAPASRVKKEEEEEEEAEEKAEAEEGGGGESDAPFDVPEDAEEVAAEAAARGRANAEAMRSKPKAAPLLLARAAIAPHVLPTPAEILMRPFKSPVIGSTQVGLSGARRARGLPPAPRRPSRASHRSLPGRAAGGAARARAVGLEGVSAGAADVCARPGGGPGDRRAAGHHPAPPAVAAARGGAAGGRHGHHRRPGAGAVAAAAPERGRAVHVRVRHLRPRLRRRGLHPRRRYGAARRARLGVCTRASVCENHADATPAPPQGLGKTLQAIALLWTLLRQGKDGAPIAKRVMIVCPTSLVSNWDSECGKWLNGAVRTLPIAEATKAEVVKSLKSFLGPMCKQQARARPPARGGFAARSRVGASHRRLTPAAPGADHLVRNVSAARQGVRQVPHVLRPAHLRRGAPPQERRDADQPGAGQPAVPPAGAAGAPPPPRRRRARPRFPTHVLI